MLFCPGHDKFVIYRSVYYRLKEAVAMGKFVIKPTNTGLKFDLKASNGEVIASSQVYKLEKSVLNGIQSVIRKHITDLSFEFGCHAFQRGDPRFAEYFLEITEALRSTPEGKEMLEKCRKQDRKDP